MSFHLPTVYPITDVGISGLTHANQVRLLARAGATLIQLREKHGPSDQFYADALEAVEVGRKLGARVIINDRVDIALATGADGVHLGQTDMPPDAARRFLGPSAVIGYSTHSYDEATAAADMPIDYLAVGPIFQTTSKEEPDPLVGLTGLLRMRTALPRFPIVAIGGISQETIAQVMAAGADSAAIISAIWHTKQGGNMDFEALVARASVK